MGNKRDEKRDKLDKFIKYIYNKGKLYVRVLIIINSILLSTIYFVIDRFLLDSKDNTINNFIEIVIIFILTSQLFFDPLVWRDIVKSYNQIIDQDKINE